jgi:hypothetical protein
MTEPEYTERERAAWRMGYDACTRGVHYNPFADAPETAAERAAWQRGWKHSLRDERPATE